jgi:hypothetical protein
MFSITVFLPIWENQLIEPWLQALKREGLTVEFDPDFSLIPLKGGLTHFKVQVQPNAFPAAELYGDRPLFVILETFARAFQFPGRIDDQCVPATHIPLFKRCVRYVWFDCTLEHSDLIHQRFTYFVGATLAEVSGGLLIGGEFDILMTGTEALPKIRKLCDQVEAENRDILLRHKPKPFVCWDPGPPEDVEND